MPKFVLLRILPLLFLGLGWPLTSFAQTASTSRTPINPLTPPDDSPLNATLKSRFFAPYTDTTGNGWLNELTVTYDLSKNWSLGIFTGYVQFLDPSKSSGSDFEDTELFVTYKRQGTIGRGKHAPKGLFELYFGPVVPTSTKADQMMTETGGVVAKDHAILDYSYVKFEQWLSVYRFFYQNQSYVEKPTVTKPTQNSDSENDFSLTDVTVGTPTPTVDSNSAYYIWARFIGLLPVITKSLNLRNEIALESWQNFDGSAENVFHDIPGIGYSWSSHFTTWLSFDCNKNLSQDGSIFDKDHIVTLMTAYISI